MGVFPEEGENDDDAEDKFKKDKSSSSYIAYHARRQLAFDMWWYVIHFSNLNLVARLLIFLFSNFLFQVSLRRK